MYRHPYYVIIIRLGRTGMMRMLLRNVLFQMVTALPWTHSTNSCLSEVGVLIVPFLWPGNMSQKP